MVKSKVWIYEKQIEGAPKPGDLKLIEEELLPIKDGEFLAEAVFLSVDPYMRLYASGIPLGETFIGQQVALIKESKHPDFPVGKYVVGGFGMRTYSISDGVKTLGPALPIMVLPDFQGLPLSLALGVLGMPGGVDAVNFCIKKGGGQVAVISGIFKYSGSYTSISPSNTAYFGFLEVCKPKAGETVVVSGAAGAVGSIVGQIAKIKGCKVIGIAGSDEKLKWLKDDLGFDGVINYKTQDVAKVLKELAPQGVDCYFDNVGGEITAMVLNQMTVFGRVSICGVVSGYNDRTIKGPLIEFPILAHQLKLEGFHVNRWADRWMEGILQNLNWIKEGKIKYHETITEGFENMFDAFTSMLQGGNTGKAIVKV